MSEVKYLSLDEIEHAIDLKEEDVACPEWGGAVRIRALTVEQVDQMTKDLKAHADDEMYANMRMIEAGTVAPKIAPKDFALLRRKNFIPIARLATAIAKLSGLKQLADEAAQKNSLTTQVSGSSSS